MGRHHDIWFLKIYIHQARLEGRFWWHRTPLDMVFVMWCCVSPSELSLLTHLVSREIVSLCSVIISVLSSVLDGKLIAVAFRRIRCSKCPCARRQALHLFVRFVILYVSLLGTYAKWLVEYFRSVLLSADRWQTSSFSILLLSVRQSSKFLCVQR